MKYILVNKKPVLEPDVLKWAKWFETGNRKVAFTEIKKDLFVSTVFLAIDHNMGMGFPSLFESLVGFPTEDGGIRDIEIQRYSTWEEAKLGHKLLVYKYKRIEELK